MLRSRWVLGSVLVVAGAVAASGCGDSGTSGSGGSGSSGSGGSGGGEELYCGDAFTDPDLGEECDDGNQDDGDLCRNDCTFPKCGDASVSQDEECDDGNNVQTDACTANCVAAFCGDGFLQAGVEECDDGNTDDGDACSADCTGGVGCGNAVVEDGEECDDGNQEDSDTCTTNCKDAFCGDGLGQIGVEECDDGNTVDDDLCTNSCLNNVPLVTACPGTALELIPGEDTTVGGNTAEADPLYTGSCSDSSGPEFVYSITPTEDGILLLEMVAISEELDPVLYVRENDCEATGSFECADATYAGGAESLTFSVTAGTTYYVFADGWQATSGEFLLSAVVSGGVPGDSCPGVNVPIGGVGEQASVSGNTAPANADTEGSGNCDSPATPEVVYRVTPVEDGRLALALDPSFDASLYVRTDCEDTTTEIDCAEVGGMAELETLIFDVSAGVDYFVYVDGWDGQSGSFNLEFTMLPSN